jgi:hypothetical protein
VVLVARVRGVCHGQDRSQSEFPKLSLSTSFSPTHYRRDGARISKEQVNGRSGSSMSIVDAKSMLVEDSPLGHRPKHVSNTKSKAKIVRRKHRKNVGSFGSVSEGMSLNRQRCTWLYHIQYNQSQVLPTIYRSLYSKAPGPQRPNPMHVVLVPIHNDSMMYDCCLVCSGLLYHDHRSIYGDPYMQVDIKVRSYGDATLCTARLCWTCIL